MYQKRRRLTCDEVYDWIVSWKLKHQGNGPRYKDMIEGLSLASNSHAHYFRTRLAELGRIVYRDGHIYIPNARLVIDK